MNELERKLEDRVSSLRDSFGAKFEEAQTRLFFAMLIISVLTLLLGFALGFLVASVLGG